MCPVAGVVSKDHQSVQTGRENALGDNRLQKEMLEPQLCLSLAAPSRKVRAGLEEVWNV